MFIAIKYHFVFKINNGAAHQQPQVFQVVTNTPIRNIKIGHYPIKFFIEKHISSEDYQSVKTPTGYMQVSIPEMTAIDLLRHVKAAGHLNHIATILTELQEKLDNQRLKKILETNKIEIPIAQRLGYLLEKVGANPDIIQSLKQWLQLKKLYFVPLRSDKAYQAEQKNKDWYLYINEIIETDL